MSWFTFNNTKSSRKIRGKQENQQFLEESELDYGGSCSGYQIQNVRFRGECGSCGKSLPFEYQTSAQDSQQFRGGIGATTMSGQNYTKPKMLSSPKSCPYPQSGPTRSYPPLPYSVPPPSLRRKSEPCGQNSDPSKKGCSCGGPACSDDPGKGISDKYGGNQKAPLPCKCKCQSSRKFNSNGGCCGQSCGGIYSCAGSGSGRNCFPRNYRRQVVGPECCGSGNQNCGG